MAFNGKTQKYRRISVLIETGQLVYPKCILCLEGIPIFSEYGPQNKAQGMA